MAPKSRDSRVRLLEPLATEFAAFRSALGVGASEIGIIRDAVRAFIALRIGRDKDLEALYLAELERLNAAKLQPLRLVRTEKDNT
jgi:hypothetical protein